MKKLSDHPFTKVFWRKGVVPGAMLLRKMELLDIALEEAGVFILAIRLSLAEQGLVSELNQFLDAIKGDENSDELVGVLWGNLRNILEVTKELPNRPGERISVMDEDELEEHARTCKTPNCQIKQMFDRADKLAKGGLKLKT